MPPRRFASILVDRPGPRVLAWSERDIDLLIRQTPVGAGRPDPAAQRIHEPATPSSHAGKYRALWAWLRDLPGDRIPPAFAEIEEIIGVPLPPSCRRHTAHWSSYDGSAVARAIHDAGWIATEVNIPCRALGVPAPLGRHIIRTGSGMCGRSFGPTAARLACSRPVFAVQNRAS
jgi:hypothetical protein